MKITINQLLAAEPVLNKLASAECETATMAYSLAKIMKNISEELSLINQARNQLAQKYGERDEQGELKLNKQTGTIPIEESKQQDYVQEVNELLKQECEINIQPLPLDAIGKEINIKLSANSLLAIEPFIKM